MISVRLQVQEVCAVFDKKEYKIKATDIKLAIKKITNVGIVTENIKL